MSYKLVKGKDAALGDVRFRAAMGFGIRSEFKEPAQDSQAISTCKNYSGNLRAHAPKTSPTDSAMISTMRSSNLCDVMIGGARQNTSPRNREYKPRRCAAK